MNLLIYLTKQLLRLKQQVRISASNKSSSNKWIFSTIINYFILVTKIIDSYLMIQIKEKLSVLLTSIERKEYEKVLQLVQRHQKSKELLSFLLDKYENHVFKEEENDQQHWLHVLMMAVTAQLFTARFSQTISRLFETLIALSSPKYCIIIFKEVLHKLGPQSFRKFFLSSHFKLFYMLFCDPVTQDLIEIYQQFEKQYAQLNQDPLLSEQTEKSIINRIYIQSLECFIGNILNCPIKINKKFINFGVRMCSLVIRSLLGSSEENLRYPADALLNQIPLILMSKVNFALLSEGLNILFTRAYINHYQTPQRPFHISFLSKQAVTLLLIRTLNTQLRTDLSAPSKFNKFQEDFLIQAVNHLCVILKGIDSMKLIVLHHSEMEDLIEKMQIYLGSINPQDLFYKQILTTFVNLPYMTLQAKQKFYSQQIAKHSNQSFRVHLITQYRQLLNPACTRTVWIRSTSLLFKELRQLQPNSNIDFIGHIISMAFFWRQLLKKFQKLPNFERLCYLNVEALSNEFQQLLKSLKQGLEVKVQISQTQSNEGVRNQANLCIFRISEIIEN